LSKSSSKLWSSIENKFAVNTFHADFLARFNKYLFTHLPTADPEVGLCKKFAEHNGFLTLPKKICFLHYTDFFPITKDEFMNKLGSSYPSSEVFQKSIAVQSRPMITFSTTDADRI